MANVKVSIEYAEDSTYAEKFKDIAAGVAKAIPGAEVTGQVGREGSFEVSANGTVVYSKLENKKFPDVEEIVKAVGGAALGGAGGESNPINKLKSKCSLM